jgi:hypothetical protein
LVLCCAAAPARGLETDQFYAWRRPLQDATAAINAKINADIAEAIAEVNARDGERGTCDDVRKAIRHRFTYVLFQKPELWAVNTATLERIPATPDEELRYRSTYIYGATSRFDSIRFMPPSPTILVNGVRIGTDKLSHFFSEGAWMFLSYRYFVNAGRTDEESIERALALGLATEKTILGGSSSGVMSLGDIEANYKGLVFWKGLCGGNDPLLRETPEGWRLARAFNIAPFVTPEWDESWQPCLYTAQRWKKVKPVMQQYCAALEDPAVKDARASYAARDEYTVSERVLHDLRAQGKLEDPSRFTIDALCGLPLRDVLAPPPVAGGDGSDSVPAAGEQIRPREH